MYTLSKDYETLWSFVEAGHDPICLVDYKWDENKVCRDIARIRRHEPFQIQIGARGIGYGSVDSWDEELGTSEKAAFIDECTRMNLEWVCP